MVGTFANRFFTAGLLVGLLSLGGWAQGAIAEVRDEGHFFSAAAVSQANDIIKEIKQRYKKDLLIETARHVPDNKKDEANSSDEKVKGRFFANWAVERARMAGVNGIYVLISREPGHVEVAVGNQTHAVFSNDERHRLSQMLLTHFRNKEYDEGLLAAVKDVRTVLASSPATGTVTLPPINRNQPTHNPPAAPRGRAVSNGGSWMSWLVMGLVVLVGVWLFSALMRAMSGNQPRPVGTGYGDPGGMGTPYGGNGGYGGGPGGGGFFSSLMGGLFGAAAGSWLYDQFSGGHSHFGGYGPMGGSPTTGTAPDRPDTDYTTEGGDFGQQAEADDNIANGGFGNDNSSWGSGGGGDFGGGDFGGGDSGGSGGDF